MKKILLKHLAALKKVSMLIAVCALGTNMSAQIIAESFEGPTPMPPGWTNDFSSWWNFLQESGGASHGDKCLRVGTQVGTGAMGGYLSTPPIALTAGQTIQISFDYSVVDIDDNGGKMWIYVGGSNNINDIENYLHEIDFTTTLPYTTLNLTFTAEETKEYYVIFSVLAEGSMWPNLSTTMFKFLLDRVVVENLSTCTSPTDIVVTETASNIVNLNWDAAGTETAWEVQVTNGVLPVATNWIEATTSQKDVNVVPGRTYSAYVRSKCPGGGYSSFYGPKIFTVSCPETIKAPYTVPFGATTIPGCWQQSGDTNWKFSTGGDYAAKKAGDHTLFEGYTQYAWVDGTNNFNGKKAILLSPKVDVSELNNPAVEFYVYSENNNNGIFNEFLAEVFNGSTWQTVATLTGSTNGWKFYSIDLTALNITTVAQLRITVIGNTESDATYFNDILVDDVAFREKTTCLPLSNFITDVITDTSANISWDSENNTSTWDIAYRKYQENFDGIANITEVGNTYTLNELEAVSSYNIYIRANCGNGTVGEWTGPYYLRTDCPVYTPYYEEPFTPRTDYPFYDYYSPGMPDCWITAAGGDITSGPSEYGTGDWKATMPNGLGVVGSSETVSISFNGNANKSWFLSPLFNLSGEEYEAKITIAINPGITTSDISMGTDDKVYMLYSTNGTTWNILKTWSTEDNLTTGFHTSIVSLDGINGENVRFAFMTEEGVIDDNIAYRFHLDNLIIREKALCLEPLNLFVDGITNISAKIGWENPGTATSWKVAVVPAGVTPTNEWETVFTNPYPAGGLTANTAYDVYVISVCGSIGAEVTTGPFTFKTRCVPIMAPYTETFVDYYEMPNCWTVIPEPLDLQLIVVPYWNFTTDAKFDASTAGDHTEGGETQYAWFNTSGLNNKSKGALSTPLVDVSSLQNPALQFYVFSKNTIDNTLNPMVVEVYNGTQWLEATRIENYTNNWAPYTIDLTALGATEIIEARFSVTINTNGGNSGYNNILIDDVAFIEMPQCIAPINLVVTEITDTTAEVVWEDLGASTSWEIEYGPKGFSPGTGIIVTVNTNPEVTLTDLDDNQEYDVYIKSLCDDELVGPQTFITDTTAGIIDLAADKITLYPNPVSDVLNLESNTTIDTIEVYNIVGQLVKKQSFNTSFTIIVMNDLSEGIYMVKAFSGKNVSTYKVIKK
ncbi:Fibronectin type III domain protein [compost metagenome]